MKSSEMKIETTQAPDLGPSAAWFDAATTLAGAAVVLAPGTTAAR